MQKAAAIVPEPFVQAFSGRFTNMLRWEQFDRLRETILAQHKHWYVYAVGHTPPVVTASHEELLRFLDEINILLRDEHQEDYCGIVYVDDPEDPEFVKIYDPNNLGAVCGSSGAPPPLPGWILSTLMPLDLELGMPLPGNRRRWWQRLFS